MWCKDVGLLFAIVLGVQGVARAENPVAADVKGDHVLKAEAPAGGWAPKLTIGANASYNHNKSVVGQIDGGTAQIGVLLDGAANWTGGNHDWQNALGVQVAQTRTPQIDRFVKSADSLKLRSLYVYHLDSVDWLGPFVQLKLDTQIFRGYDVRASGVTIQRTNVDGSVVTKNKPAQSTIPLTDPFAPLLLSEALGLFARPVAEKIATIELKLGAGAQQIWGQDGYAIKDNKDTAQLEIVQIDDSQQVGAGAELTGKGELTEAVVWGVNASVFYPFYSNTASGNDAPTGSDALQTEVTGKLAIKLAKWASLDYVLGIKKIPLILDAWQIQNVLLFTAAFNVI